jgi:hypothetical protein
MGLGTKTLQVIWARELLLEIAYAEQNGSLPPSPTSWSVRRAGYLRQQRNFQALAREFGLAAANKDRVIKAIRAHQFTILRAATDEGASAADFEIYKEDMIEQVADEKLAMRYRDFFRRTSEASKMTAARFGAMVEAGDRQARVKR